MRTFLRSLVALAFLATPALADGLSPPAPWPLQVPTTTDNTSSVLWANIPQEAQAVPFRTYVDGAGTNAGDVTVTKTVSGAANNGSGLVRLTLNNTTSLVTSNPITVSGVLGTTEANGTWAFTVIDGTHIDLYGSTFSHAYTSGGSAVHTTRNNAVMRAGFNIDVTGNALDATKGLAYLAVESHYQPDATNNALEGYFQVKGVTSATTFRPFMWGYNLVDNTSTTQINGTNVQFHQQDGSTEWFSYATSTTRLSATGELYVNRGGAHSLLKLDQKTPSSFNVDLSWDSNGTNKWLTSVRTATGGNDDFWLFNGSLGATAIQARFSDNVVTFGAPAKLASYTVATLPSASTAGAGATAFVTDSNATMTAGIGATVVGGGANKVPVYSDGTNWKIG